MKLLWLVLIVVSFQWSSAYAMKVSRYVSYNGAKIAMYESKGTHGPAILFVHGNTSSSQSYERVINSAYGHYQKMVAVDLPGYGNSDNASVYNVSLLVGAIVKAAQVSGADRGVIVGWSLGGDLILQAKSSLPNAKGFLMFGTAPVGVDASLPAAFLSPSQSYAGAAVNYGFIPNLSVQQVNDYVTAFFRPNYSPIPAHFYADGQRTDPGTRLAIYLAATGQDSAFVDEIAVVRSSSVPMAIVSGDKDAFVNPDFLDALAPSVPHLFANRIIKVKNSGHAIHWEHPEIFNIILASFVFDVSH